MYVFAEVEEEAKSWAAPSPMMTAATWQAMTDNGEGGGGEAGTVQTVPKYVVSKRMPEPFVKSASVSVASLLCQPL